MYQIDARGKSVLIISDAHIPYSHRDYISILTAIKEQLKPDIIINVGDELDFHGISFHDKEAELMSGGHELDKAIVELQEGLIKLFPVMDLCESNHGSMMTRKLKHHGIPVRVLRSMQDLYQAPGWKWHEGIKLLTRKGKTLVTHGKTSAYGKLAKENGCNAIQGHFHGKFEITWHKSDLGEFYNMFVGCLVDYWSLAMRYGRNFVQKPILGVGYISKSGMPRNIKMIVNKENRWIGKLSL